MLDIIHFGFPKCASTFIQNVLLPSVADLNYIDLHGIMENFHTDDAFYNDKAVKSEINCQLKSDKINVASSEYIVNSFQHWSRSFDRLATLYPDVKILIIIRNQSDFLSSYYQEKVRGGAGYSFENFVKYYCRSNGALDACKYTFIIDKLKNNFSDVRVELYETMFKNDGRNALLKFLGSKEQWSTETTRRINAKYSPFSHFITLQINRFQPTKMQGFRSYMAQEYFKLLAPSIDKLVAKVLPNWKLHHSKEILEFIREFYAKDNHQLQKFFNDDLHEIGYY